MKRIFLLSLLLTGCSVDSFDDANVFGPSRQVTCFSGGKQVFSEEAATKIQEMNDGLGFKGANTGSYYRVPKSLCFVEIKQDK